MGQRDIINYLIKYPTIWISRDEILRATRMSKDAANKAITKLVQAGEIERRYERIDNPDKPGTKRVITWVKLTTYYKEQLNKEGIL